MSSIIDDWTALQQKIEKQGYNNGIDELMSKFKDRYYHMIDENFDNVINEMEKFAEKLKIQEKNGYETWRYLYK